MEISKKLIINTINDMNSDNIKKFNKVYCFQDDIERFDKDTSNLEIIEKFIYSYLCRTYLLYDINQKDFNVFINWFDPKGKDNLIILINEVSSIDRNKLTRFCLRYDILMEQTIYERNSEGLLDLLIDIPMSVETILKYKS